MLNFLNTPLGYLLSWLSDIFGGNFALSVFVFTLIINLAMLPLTIKTQKSTSKQARLRPKLDALKKKYGDDRQKYAQATQELYTKENVSMAGGCLPMVIRTLFIFAVYYVISDPLQYLMHFSAEEVGTIAQALKDSGYNVLRNVDIIGYVSGGEIANVGLDSALVEKVTMAVSEIDFDFFGIDLTKTPTFSLKFSEMFKGNLWVIPFMSLASNLLSSFISTAAQKRSNPEAPSMTLMLFMMPLLSFYITFQVPCALGLYWTMSSIIGIGFQMFSQYLYSAERIIASEQAQGIIKLAAAEEKHTKNSSVE